MPSDPNEFKKYFPPPEIVEPRVEVPPTPPPPPPDKISSGMTPMEQITQEGQAMRGMASGRIPWWVLITGWVILGVPAAVMLYIAWGAGFWGAILPATISGILILILVRGTQKKLKQKQRR